MASAVQSNPVYYSLSEFSSVPYSSTSSTPSSRTVVLRKRSGHDGFGVYIGEDIPSGLYVVTVERNSPASDVNIQPGDRVLSINGKLVSSMSENPKEVLVKAASNSDTLTLTIQSNNILQSLNIPTTTTTNNSQYDNDDYNKKKQKQHQQQQQSARQTLPLNSDLESYIKSLFANENVQILQTSNNNEFIIQSDPYRTSSTSAPASAATTDFRSVPYSPQRANDHKKERRQRRHHHREHRQTKKPLHATIETQTSIDYNDENNGNIIQEQLPISPQRQYPPQPAMGISQRTSQNQYPPLSTRSSDESMKFNKNSDSPRDSPSPRPSNKNIQNKGPFNPTSQHMSEVVEAVLTVQRNRQQQNNHEQLSPRSSISSTGLKTPPQQPRYPPSNARGPDPTPRHPPSNARDPGPISRDPPSTSRNPAPTSRDQPPTSGDPALTSRDQPPTSRDQPPTSRDQHATSRDQPPTSRDQPPTSRDQPPTSRDQPPTSRDQHATSRDQPPTSRDQPPTSRDQPPTSRDQPPTSRDQPPTSRNPAPTSRDPAPISRDPVSTSRNPAATIPAEPPPYVETAPVYPSSQPPNNTDNANSGAYNVRDAEANQQPEVPMIAASGTRPQGIRDINIRRVPDFQGFGFHIQYNKQYFLVRLIEAGSPAEHSGLHAHDVILTLNGEDAKKIRHNKFVEIVNVTNNVQLQVQTLDEYLHDNPQALRNPQTAAAIAAAISNDTDKRKTGISKAIGKLTNR